MSELVFSPAREAAQMIRKHRNNSIQIISHMDADGICAAAIISKALNRLDIENQVKFVRMLYRDVVGQLDPAGLNIFTDLGSSQLRNVGGRFRGHDVIIADHHELEEADGWPELVHVSASLCGLDGLQGVSGAGMAYLIAQELDEGNTDLSSLAIVGALGDIQNAWGKLQGYNRKIAEDAAKAGTLEYGVDLLLYGRYTRSILRALESFSDPPIPGITGSLNGCISMLEAIGLPYKTKRGWRRPVDLTHGEKRRLATELIGRAMADVPDELVKYVPNLIIGEVFTMSGEADRSALRDANEFSTCVNATARHEQPLIGFEVAKGDRKAYHRAMLNLLRYHRRCISDGMGFIEKFGLMRTPGGHLQYFDATGELKETFVGTIANMAISHRSCDPYKPVVGIVREGGTAKVSARCPRLLFLRGLDLSRAIREAAEKVGGEGGGHAIACGAQVDEERIQEFLEAFEARVEDELAPRQGV